MTTQDKLSELARPFSLSSVNWRVGLVTEDRSSGQALPYLDARVVMDRFDEVLGVAAWEDTYEEVIVGNRMVAVRCTISVDVEGRRVSKQDAAQLDTVVDKPTEAQARKMELAVKGVYSDAFKRAAVKWGVGRYLYAYRAPWVKLTERGHLAAIPRLPDAMLPENERGQKSPQEQEASAELKGEQAEILQTTDAPAQDEADAHAQPQAEGSQGGAPAQESAQPEEAAAAKGGNTSATPAQEEKPTGASEGADASVNGEAKTTDKVAEPESRAANEDALSDFAKSIISKIGHNGMDKATLLQYVNSPRCRAKLAEGEHAVVVSKIQAAA
jgi:hypothetical protein